MAAVSAATATNKISTQLKLLVRTLKYFGGYPIKIKTASSSNKSKTKSNNVQNENLQHNLKIQTFYETTTFQWTTAGAWYSYVVHALKIFSFLTYLCNIALDIPYPANLNLLIENIFSFSFGPELKNIFGTTESGHSGYGIEYAVPTVLHILKLLINFWLNEYFVRWLNNWSYFERDFLNCFKTAVQLDIRRFLIWVLIIYLALPTVIVTVLGIKYMLPMYIHHVKFVSQALMIVAMISYSAHALMEDAKMLIMFKAQALALQQIVVGIRETGQSSPLAISAKQVIGWRELLKQVRSQTKLASEYFKSPEMMFVAETVLVCSLGLSYFLRIVSKPGSMTPLLTASVMGNLYYSTTNFLRLYIKVLLAEKISEEELLVADEVLQIDSKIEDAATKTELKFLHCHITQNTIAVNFGNYCCLDKKLLLNVGVQVVTYLIVIMQFQSSK